MQILGLLDDGSFIRRCCDRLAAVTDAPDEFLLGAFLSLTAALEWRYPYRCTASRKAAMFSHGMSGSSMS